MAAAADSSSAAASHQSPRPEFDGAGVNRRSTPWAKVVRGDSESSSPPLPSSEPELNPTSVTRSSPSPLRPPDASSSESGDDDLNSNAAGGKKPVWNKLAKEEVVEAGPVMGAEAWPALSESAWASPKLPADSSPRTLPDVSIPPPVSPGPVVAPSPSSKRLQSNHANTNRASTHAMPARQRPAKRGGGSTAGGSNAQPLPHQHPRPQGVFAPPPLPPPPPPFPVFPIPNGYGTLVSAMPDPSPRGDPSFRGSNWEARPMAFGPQTHQVNDPRNSSRRGNFGSRTRGDGSFHNSYGSKRYQQDRGNHNNGRDAQMHQQQRPSPRSRVRPVPPSGATFSPQPAGTFVNPMGYPEFIYLPTLPMDPTRMSFLPHAPHPAMFVPVAEPPVPSLHSLIINQIDYYFSDMNLIRDEYLRSNMDAQGWVPVSLIANFPRVKSLTTDVQMIMDSLRSSSIVEVQDDSLKLRRRNDWAKWISTSGRLASESGSSSSDIQSSGMLSTSFLKMTVDDASTSQSSMSGNPDVNSKATPQNFSTELAGVSQLPNGVVTQQ